MAKIFKDGFISKGATTLTADATTIFDMSSLDGGGNVVTISNNVGGVARITVDGSTPNGTTTSAALNNAGVYLSGGNAVYEFEPTFRITSVRIRPITDAWGVTMVTVQRGS